MSPKSRLAATLLAFFFGAFGVHRFYVGKTGSGVAQLLLTITIVGVLVSGIWSFIDLIVIIAGSFTDKEGRRIGDWTAQG